ncbi:MAG TPA: patatin-like phospholipase family protein [Xanthobacteraceae bacterium]|jgi:NTE family protein|nr:patatin-like phospholipase family protein [Xanthobacteraceae bacterium]
MADIETNPVASTKTAPALPGQVVLVFQGGGALGAYQGGVYQALHEADIEPDWVIGTSVGAINAAIIAGNEPGRRLDRLREFWDRMERKSPWEAARCRRPSRNFRCRSPSRSRFWAAMSQPR